MSDSGLTDHPGEDVSDPPSVVAFDLETTGTDAATDRIVEFCFLTLDEHLNERERWVQRVNPDRRIPAEATEIHGIRDVDVATKPTFANVAPKVQGLVADAILIAYNVGFDVDLLDRELRRAGEPGLDPSHPTIDVHDIFIKHVGRRLEDAVRYYLRRDHHEAHAAEGDTDAMLDVFQAQRVLHDLDDSLASLAEPERRWLDRGRRIYEDEDGVARFAFGKHEGAPLVEHRDYVESVVLNPNYDFPASTREAARERL